VEGSKADHVVVDYEGYAFKHYNVGQPGSEDKYRVFVIRPDGYIGAIVEGEEGLERYGKLVFGPRPCRVELLFLALDTYGPWGIEWYLRLGYIKTPISRRNRKDFAGTRHKLGALPQLSAVE
ncbi:hypothetical protein L218DRAFT_992379, partial [Marasmius fiardii PR-910]